MDWTSERQPELPALKERIGIKQVSMQCRIGGEMVVAKKEEGGAMDLVTAGAGCNIHGPACRCSSAQIKVHSGDLKFLHCLLGEAHGRPTISDLHDAATVDGNAGCASILAHRTAQQWNQRAIVACPRRLLRSRLEFS